MVRSLLPKTRTEWLTLVILTTTVTLLGTSGLVFRSIYNAAGIALETKVTLTTSAENTSGTLIATRVSRGGARFSMMSDTAGVWHTTEWVRALEIQSTLAPDDDEMTTITVGSLAYNIPLHSLPYTTSEHTKTYTITLAELERTGTVLPFFTTILNWPGNGVALVAALQINTLSALAFFMSTFLLIIGYQYWIRQSLHRINVISRTQPEILLLVGCFVLSGIATLLFIQHAPTAYDWPALDMGPFFMRAADSTFLLNDFFTNASMHPNPRFIFGYLIIGIGNVLHLSWYDVFFLLKSFLTVFLPPLIFVTLASFFRHEKNNQKKLQIIFSLFCFTLVALFPLFINQFTIALWSPYQVTPTPHALAFFTGLFAIFAANHNKRVLGVLCFALTTVLLPTIGLSVLCVYAILNWSTLTKRDGIEYLGLGVLTPCLALAYCFAPSVRLTSTEFVYQYIISNHSIHYLPSAFETSTNSPLPWYFHFIFLTSTLCLITLIGYVQKNRYLYVATGLACLCYLGAVLSCYLFIERYPNQLVAMIGPSRFTLFGYWFIALFSTHLIVTIPHRFFPFLTLTRSLTHFSVKKVQIGLLVCLTLVASGIATTYRDNPTETWSTSNSALAAWIAHTAQDAVFASNSLDLKVNIPLITHRAIFSGNGFPFSPDDFVAFNTRRALLYGSPEDWATMSGNSDRIKSDNFYRRLTPSDFARIAVTYPLDYVIIESSFSENFASYTPLFTSADIRIYRVNDFSPTP